MAKTTQGAKPGPGELAERAKRRRMIRTVASLMVAGGVTGFTLALTETGPEGILNATITPTIAIALTLAYLVACGLGAFFMLRDMDEHELAFHYWSSAVAGSAYALAYPAWFLLWKGRLVREPDHLTLFILFIAVSFAAYLFKKSR